MKLRCLLPMTLFLAGLVHARPLHDVTPVTQDVQQIVSMYALDGASLLLLRNGSPVYKQHFGSYSDSTRVPIASASKWLSALTLARLIEQGQMSWEDPIGRYIANAP